jgi:hypothetical protein
MPCFISRKMKNIEIKRKPNGRSESKTTKSPKTSTTPHRKRLYFEKLGMRVWEGNKKCRKDKQELNSLNPDTNEKNSFLSYIYKTN